jgi:hypothetical protein
VDQAVSQTGEKAKTLKFGMVGIYWKNNWRKILLREFTEKFIKVIDYVLVYGFLYFYSFGKQMTKSDIELQE